VLRQLKNSGAASIPFRKLDMILRNAGVQQFSYETFDAQFQSDPRLQNIVTNYDQEEIRFKQSEVPGGASDQAPDTVGQMAKRATDVGATL
jgi:hypothetical protein